ncbi:MAG: hypothetical protein PHY59_02180 [Methanobacterium sp.]|nr:hypothetical protein [Methanobacterium sp.]
MYKVKADGTRGEQIFNEEEITWTDGYARISIPTGDWPRGEYRLCIIYWGNGDDLPRLDRNINIHIK